MCWHPHFPTFIGGICQKCGKKSLKTDSASGKRSSSSSDFVRTGRTHLFGWLFEASVLTDLTCRTCSFSKRCLLPWEFVKYHSNLKVCLFNIGDFFPGLNFWPFLILIVAGLEPHVVHSQPWPNPVFPEHSAGVGPLCLFMVAGPFLLSSSLLPWPWMDSNVLPLHCQNGETFLFLHSKINRIKSNKTNKKILKVLFLRP